MGVVAVVAGVDVGVYLAGGDDVCQVSVAVGGLFGYVFVFSSGSGGEYWFVYFLVKLVGACADETETFQMQAIYGMFLSDLAYEPSFKEFIEKRTWTRKIIALPLFITGLLIASYPGENPEWAHWSNTLYKTAHYLFPPEVNIGKRYTALGIDLIIFAIYISPSTKSFLSNPPPPLARQAEFRRLPRPRHVTPHRPLLDAVRDHRAAVGAQVRREGRVRGAAVDPNPGTVGRGDCDSGLDWDCVCLCGGLDEVCRFILCEGYAVVGGGYVYGG